MSSDTVWRSSQYVEVQLEIGHRATPKTKIAQDGHTHDWTVFVRGPENSIIEHFVDKVVFHLHDSFPKPKRVVKEPPYQVSESGYASFELPVEVYFKNKEEPKKISFEYDLYLRLDDAVSHSRREKLTFQNPSNDFKKKLLKAGGVTKESSGTTAKSTSSADEKQQTQQTSSTNTTKYSKASVSGNESKKSKASGVIPSKDKSLNNSQNSTTILSSNQSFAVEKHTIPNSSNNKQFTELFGPPIQARPSSDSVKTSKIKESSKNKCTAIASKGVKNDSKTLHKNSAKNTYLSPTHRVLENKSSKDTKETKDTKDSKDTKGTNKSKESTKSKHEDEEPSNKSKKKSTQSQSIPTFDFNDKKCDFKESKKRRNSTSSNSSSITCKSFGGSTEPKQHKDSQKLGSVKDYDNKKESKKQKVSSKDINSASGVKKQSSTSTKISFSNNNSSTTIEIKSVKKEKTWDNEVKKSKSKEFKSSEFKSAKEKVNSNASNSNTSASNSSKTKAKPESNTLKSSKLNGNKHLKAPKDKYSSNNRERSSSPSSGISGSLTPGGVALSSSSSIHGPINSVIVDMDSPESMSPLSSDTFPIRFEPIRSNRDNNDDTNDRLVSDDSESDDSQRRSTTTPHLSKTSNSRDLTENYKNKMDSKSQTNKRKRDSKEVNKRFDQLKNDRSLSPGIENCVDFNDSFLLKDLIEMQKRISESTNTDFLQKIVDTIEESGLFCVTKTTFDFDLMKLDKTTLRKLKAYLS